MRTLHVFWGNDQVGRLDRPGKRDMTFSYASSWLEDPTKGPISLSLPLQEEPFDPDLSRAWFANLLPEGEIRRQVARKLGVSERNDFDLLEGLGGDCAGALRIVPEAMTREADPKLIPLSRETLEKAVAARPARSLLASMLQDTEMRLSLAGAQDKLPVHFRDGKLSLPAGSAASTHLLKVGSDGFPDLVFNELFCLRLARGAGLPVPHAELLDTKTPILMVERYDRTISAEGGVARLHQEDFCQALGAPPETKYETEGGPSLADIFAALGRGSRSPLPDKGQLVRWVLFNYLVGNADAHAKNLSLVYSPGGMGIRPRLAPFYDLVCTGVYEGLTDKMAQKIGGEYRPDFLRRRHWEKFAQAIGVNFGYLGGVGRELCDAVERECGLLRDDFDGATSGSPVVGKITGFILRRVERMGASFPA